MANSIVLPRSNSALVNYQYRHRIAANIHMLSLQYMSNNIVLPRTDPARVKYQYSHQTNALPSPGQTPSTRQVAKLKNSKYLKLLSVQ